ncbi:Hypothetical protein, putative [Bodo saltans]|uniref:Uncharacterized protein n=1 Tax=Bodo saltans TaxID=75058 RepID=A0A0S4JE91_BODSA|nr:Hypothetical protein, putative [Bodo saltans]|eukprot:CUG88289.1 Hypothetical protein, putative [Bodo saltans]
MEVTDTLFAALQQHPAVFRNYAMTDLARVGASPEAAGAEPQPSTGCIFLFRHSVHVDFAEFQPRLVHAGAGGGRIVANRPLVLLHMRNFAGNSCTLGIVHLDPTNTLSERCAAVGAAITKMDNDDIVALAANYGDHVVDAKDHELRKELGETMRGSNMADSYEVATDAVNSAPVSLWVKVGSKAMAQSVQPLPGDRRWCRFGSLIQLQFRSSMGGSQSSPLTTAAGIAIPQPRSAKGSKNSPSTGMMYDPMVLGLDEKLLPPTLAAAAAAAVAVDASPPREGINVASLLGSAMKPRLPRFRKDNAFHMKGSNRNLSQDESPYDLSQNFSSVSDAVERINNGGFQWVADYFVVNNTIIAADHITQCDLKSFRRYVQSKPNPWSLLNAQSAVHLPPSHAGRDSAARNDDGGVNVAQLLAEKTSRKEHLSRDDGRQHAAAPSAVAPPPPPSAQHHHHHHVQPQNRGPVVRPRLWSESFCTILYQVTPKEMVFDISPFVGNMRGNLKTAITRLNTKKTMAAALSDKPDPLLDYGHDYALLYCPERQAYWLLAASDVPCDIVACRHAAS